MNVKKFELRIEKEELRMKNRRIFEACGWENFLSSFVKNQNILNIVQQ